MLDFLKISCTSGLIDALIVYISSEFTMEELKSWLPGEENPNRSVVPSEILKKEQKHSHERVLPSHGISYPILTKVLSEFGFSPRLYNLFSLRNP